MLKLLMMIVLMVQPISHGPRGTKKVALTFDACPTSHKPSFDRELFNWLWKGHGMLDPSDVTVFVAGAWAVKHPDAVRKMGERFSIQNHGYVHIDRLQEHLTYEEARADIAKAQRVIKELTGTSPRYYRPPGFKYNDNVLLAASDLGLTVVTADAISGDPDPNLTVDAIVKWVVYQVKRRRGGSIIIFHINGKGWKSSETVPRTYRMLLDEYKFVSLDELLKEDS